MPVLDSESYQPPIWLKNHHLQTVYPSLMRRVTEVGYERERLELQDGDFLDLDWSRVGSQRLAVISHGLEGNSRKAYVLGMARALNRAGWDVLAWNFRGCSGIPNRLPRFYHNGDTGDLAAVVTRGVAQGGYRAVALVGFSMGGNITLNYLGGAGPAVDPAVAAGVAISVPCDLRGAAMELARPVHRIYMHYFLHSLLKKIRKKQSRFPELLNDTDFARIKDFHAFDSRYTAPLHGFADARDYWAKTSSLPRLEGITLPVLLVNARNDPFLSSSCYPVSEAGRSGELFLEMPGQGGHVGFAVRGAGGGYWSEHRAVAFLSSVLGLGALPRE